MWCPFWRKFPKSTGFKNTNLARGAGDDDGVDDEEDDWDEDGDDDGSVGAFLHP